MKFNRLPSYRQSFIKPIIINSLHFHLISISFPFHLHFISFHLHFISSHLHSIIIRIVPTPRLLTNQTDGDSCRIHAGFLPDSCRILSPRRFLRGFFIIANNLSDISLPMHRCRGSFQTRIHDFNKTDRGGRRKGGWAGGR